MAEAVPLALGDSLPVRVLLVSLARTESHNYARLHEDKGRDRFVTLVPCALQRQTKQNYAARRDRVNGSDWQLGTSHSRYSVPALKFGS